MYEPAVEVGANVLSCLINGNDRLRIPLDDVEAVWESASGRWVVRWRAT